MSDPEQTPLKKRPIKLYLRLLSSWFWGGFIGLVPTFNVIVLLIIANMVFRSQIVISGCRERDIRIIGLILQLVGFSMVAFGLRQASNLFQQPTVVAQIKEYLNRFPSRRPQTQYIKARGVVARTRTGNVRCYLEPGPETSLERRVDMLEVKAKQRYEQVNNLEDNIQKVEKESKKAINDEKIQRESGEKKIEDFISEAVVGGIHIEWYGLICFVIGIILSSASPEIAIFTGHLSSCSM